MKRRNFISNILTLAFSFGFVGKAFPIKKKPKQDSNQLTAEMLLEMKNTMASRGVGASYVVILNDSTLDELINSGDFVKIVELYDFYKLVGQPIYVTNKKRYAYIRPNLKE